MTHQPQVVTGCSDCPFLTQDDDQNHSCSLSDNVTIPFGSNEEVTTAIPHECPLWEGPVTVQMRGPSTKSTPG